MPLEGWERVKRDDEYYKACTVATTAVGAIAGLAVGASGAPLTGGLSVPVVGIAGALLGFGAGYLLCPYLAPVIKKKIETGASMTPTEISSAAEAMGRYAGVHSAGDAIQLLALVKRSAATASFEQQACIDPRSTAKSLLVKTCRA